MNRIDIHFERPLEHLVCDEVLLDQCDQGLAPGSIRFWESEEYCVVLGYGNDLESEVDSERCREGMVPVFRRCSGGGTVMLGQGCLNYSLVLPINGHDRLASVSGANEFIMERNRAAVQGLVQDSVAVRGDTDLVRRDIKFSGNAQRRRRNALLFHGTFLLDFDLTLLERFLRMPSRQPEYRMGRSHSAFIGNLSVPRNELEAALMDAWSVEGNTKEVDRARVIEMASQRRQSSRWQLIDP